MGLSFGADLLGLLFKGLQCRVADFSSPKNVQAKTMSPVLKLYTRSPRNLDSKP